MSATREFLLERPHVLARSLFYSLFFLLLLVIIISFWATINVAVSGKGVVASTHEIVDVHAPSKMVVQDVFVQRGGSVSQYDLMAVLTDGQSRYEIRAPIDGTVAFVNSFYRDTLVNLDEPMFVIFPSGHQLVAKLEIFSQQMKTVELGQVTNLKIDAYPFRNYGVWRGWVSYVSPTTRLNKEGVMIYDLIVEIDREFAESKSQKLIAGQSLVADIVVVRVSVFDYMLNFIRGVNYYL
jgi:multidrug efflux pump subunit AcrA (membrane-fusion protein)